MKLTFFKPSDFSRENVDAFNWQEKSSEQANAKLNEALGQQVYINNKAGTHWTTFKTQHDEHTAYLFNTQPIKECEHSPMPNRVADINNIKCSKCGVELEPTGWRVRE